MVENIGKKLQNITHIPSFLYLSLIESCNSPRVACTKKREGERSSADGPERGRGTEGPQSGPVPGPRRREAARRAAAAA